MFTPPPSPLPAKRQAIDSLDVTQRVNNPIEDTHIMLSKQRFRCVMRWTIILVPLTLTLLAVFTRSWAHPAFLDLLSVDGDHEWIEWAKVMDWSLHEPHSATSNRLNKRSTPDSLAARDASGPVPMIPVNPTLPTPFPSAFDETLSANFTTTSCYDFFLNMTQTDAFRFCRAFSMLSSTSYAFSQAQDNITLMNTIIWGTCNTNPGQKQCDENMSWFASSLQLSCQADLENQVRTAVLTFDALQAYDLMRNAACTVDSSTNSYCYVEAVANSDPSSFWFYQLPLGQPLGPNITMSACNACTSNLMSSYASALNGAESGALSGLTQTYNVAVETTNKVCGTTYAKVEVSKAGLGWANASVPRMSSLLALAGLVIFAGMLCSS